MTSHWIRRRSAGLGLLLGLVFLHALPGCEETKKTEKRAVRKVPPGPPRWTRSIRWMEYGKALERAAAENKPICLVLYTNWCPRCRELAPVFGEPDIVTLARRFVMVKQNTAHRRPWMEKYRATGKYVPQVLFLDSTGKLKADVTSGNGRYPYYYHAGSFSALKRSMLKAQR